MPYIHFTEEQKLRASEVDLVEFLRHQGEKLIHSGPEYRLDSDHSVTVRGNGWYDHAAGQGGGPISFVQQFYNLSYPEAVTCLLGGEQGVVYTPAPKQEEASRKEFALPPASREMRRMYAYLLKHRFLNRDVVTAFVRAGLIYESCESYKGREYHNAVFVGKDENGVARHAHKRSLNSFGRTFRINVEGSDPRCSFHYTGTSDRLYVFEAPIDLMSFLTRYPRGWQEHSFVSLCGTSEHAMLWMLERNPNLHAVCLCLDHDAAGIEASGRLTEILHGRGYDNVGMLQPEYKDWNEDLILLIFLAGGMLLLIAAATHFSGSGNLDNIKSKTVGNGQHGTAQWANRKEIQQTYRHIPFHVAEWRSGKNLPKAQGLVLGCVGKKNAVTALVDVDDIHCLMIGASGVGKTAFFLYPNMEYACASGMSFLALDTKGDLARNYGAVASKYYGYKVAVIDLRNPTKSDGYNLLTLINRYMDICREQPTNLAARAKAEKYAKILAKTIINPEGDAGNYGQNQFFYDSAEGLLTAVVLLLAEYLPPTEEAPQERRHIVSVFKLVQDLLAPSKTAKGKNGFQVMMDTLPDTHKARWFAGAALNSAEQAMASVMSTVLSRLNAFLDSELE